MESPASCPPVPHPPPASSQDIRSSCSTSSAVSSSSTLLPNKDERNWAHLSELDWREIRSITFSSAVGGFLCRCLFHPIDTAKAIIQAQVSPKVPDLSAKLSTTTLDSSPFKPSEPRKNTYQNVFRSTVQTLRAVWKLEGIQGLYRGFVICGLGSIPATCLYFTSFEILRSLILTSTVSTSSPSSFSSQESTNRLGLSKEKEESEDSFPSSPSLKRNGEEEKAMTKTRERDTSALSTPLIDLVAGFGAETVSCILWVPIDVCKERLQVILLLLKEPQSLLSLSELNLSSGLKSHCFLPVSFEREVNKVEGNPRVDKGPFLLLLRGWASWSICTLQTQRALGTSKYRGSFDCIRQISTKEGGLRTLYRGYGATLLSFGPLSGLFFMFDNQLKRMLQNSSLFYPGAFGDGGTSLTKESQESKEKSQDDHTTTATTWTSRTETVNDMSSVSSPAHGDMDDNRNKSLSPLAAGGCALVAAAGAAWLTVPVDKTKLRLQIQRGATQQRTDQSRLKPGSNGSYRSRDYASSSTRATTVASTPYMYRNIFHGGGTLIG
ncbi:mitochondrial carrier domain-containing [Cystoisospora suis]|uniref:Mitochondrial carrier domain-containing n=1 Tax=Cystoisospora suis TaxID=483139 RepID=A0A2C6KU68_9APIC|nr:mitochondrial carrier domain-containing [Cystoisospora suis]